jgi:L-threonylcarbamoyladenylate synthase
MAGKMKTQCFATIAIPNEYYLKMTFETEIGDDILHAKRLLDSDHIVAIPTETVYGLAANAFSEIAVNKVYEAKKRPSANPLIVHVGSKDQIYELTQAVNDKARLLIEKFMPGPITLLLPKKKSIPEIVTSGLPEVAIRIPAHSTTAALLEQLDYPLAAPSANPFGYISPTTAKHVYDQLKSKVPYVLDGGQCKAGIESTIIGFRNGIPAVFRLGSITVADIENIVGKVIINSNSNLSVAPGMLKTHYSPTTPLVLADDSDEFLKDYDGKRIGLITYDTYSTHLPRKQQIVLVQSSNLSEIAYNLYSAMHRMDAAGYDVIIVTKLPDDGIGKSVNDRLVRASASKK